MPMLSIFRDNFDEIQDNQVSLIGRREEKCTRIKVRDTMPDGVSDKETVIF
jgi:hypothetical protein